MFIKKALVLLTILCSMNAIVWERRATKSKLTLSPEVSNPFSYNDQNESNYYELIKPIDYKSNSPILIWIHGGGWVTEDIETSRNMANNLASKYNIVTALVHYRLSQKGGNNGIIYPDHIKDSLKALTNITNSLSKFNLDGNKIFLGGHSAGAHISAMMALNADEYNSNNNVKQLNIIRNIKGIISIGGVFDLELLAKQDKSYIDDFIIPAFGNNTNSNLNGLSKWKKASPQFVTKETLQKVNYKKLPKYLLIHSDDDPLVNFDQISNFSNHLKRLGFKDINITAGSFGEHDVIPSNDKVQRVVSEFILN